MTDSLRVLGSTVALPFSMVTSSAVVDGGQCKGSDGLAKLPSRTLVYDTETGSLRYPKSRTNFKAHPKSPQLTLRSSIFEVDNDQFGVDCYLGRDHHGAGSGNFSKTECL